MKYRMCNGETATLVVVRACTRGASNPKRGTRVYYSLSGDRGLVNVTGLDMASDKAQAERIVTAHAEKCGWELLPEDQPALFTEGTV
jgi:hypothetical protein